MARKYKMIGSAKIESNKEEILKLLGDTVPLVLEEWGLIAERYAKEKCPVRTGRLRNSLTHGRDRTATYVGTNVEYAPYVELGTSRQRAQPYLKPAIVDHMNEYKGVLEKYMRS